MVECHSTWYLGFYDEFITIKIPDSPSIKGWPWISPELDLCTVSVHQASMYKPYLMKYFF